MGWKQVRNFDESKGGRKPGWCLQNVRLGYAISSHWFYPTATKSWEKNQQQHRDRNIPTGVDVPLYYTFYTRSGNEGHVNARLADGRVWSDGDYYASVEDYERRRTPDYIGWGESVNGTRVIEWVPDQAGVSIRLNGPDSQHWNVREKPSMSGAVIGRGKTPAKGGQQYSAIIDDNGWAKIEFTNRTGYVGPKTYTRL